MNAHSTSNPFHRLKADDHLHVRTCLVDGRVNVTISGPGQGEAIDITGFVLGSFELDTVITTHRLMTEVVGTVIAGFADIQLKLESVRYGDDGREFTEVCQLLQRGEWDRSLYPGGHLPYRITLTYVVQDAFA